VHEFTKLKNSLPKSLDLNSVNYSVWGIVTDKIITTCCCCSTLCSNPVQCSMDLSGRKILPDEYRETSYLVKTCGRRRRSIIKICLWYRRQTAPPLIALRARWNRFLSHFSPTGPPNVHYSLSLSLSLSLSVWSYERACGRIGIVSSIRPPAARSTPVLLPRRRSRRKLLRGSRVASLSLALPQSLADHSFIHRLRSVDSTNIAAVSCLRAFLVILRPPHLDTA